jgi:hypothetical protein
MATKERSSNETIIYVSTQSKLNLEQTQSITDELLRIIGYTNSHPEFRFRFIAGDNLIQAHASVDNELRVSIGD